MATIKKTDNTKFWQWCWQTGLLVHCHWECKMAELLFLKELSRWPSNSNLRYQPKRHINICQYEDFYTNTHRSIISNSQKLQIIQIFINLLINKILFMHWNTIQSCKRKNLIWINPKNMLSERSHACEIFRKTKSIDYAIKNKSGLCSQFLVHNFKNPWNFLKIGVSVMLMRWFTVTDLGSGWSQERPTTSFNTHPLFSDLPTPH